MKLIFLATFLFLMPFSIAMHSNTEIASGVDSWVESNVEYHFFHYPQGVNKTLATMIGDCTDKAMLKCYMLSQERVPCRLVHGYNDWGKHDWFEFYDNGWQSFDDGKRIGLGIW